MIIPIFATGVVGAELAHLSTHSVAGIALPPADANKPFFHHSCALSTSLGKKMGSVLMSDDE